MSDAADKVRAALDYGGDYMPNSRVHSDGLAAVDELDEALRLCAEELAEMRQWHGSELLQSPKADVDDVVAEFLAQARGYKAEEE